MWVMNFIVVRNGERSPEYGSPREFLYPNSNFPIPDIDHTVVHRGEMFVVDDVIWNLERKSVIVEIVPAKSDSEHEGIEDVLVEDGSEDKDGFEGDEGDEGDEESFEGDEESFEGDEESFEEVDSEEDVQGSEDNEAG